MPPVYALIINPHPDDAEVGAGGTIARWTRELKAVAYVVCTDGGKGTRDRHLSTEALAGIRKNEQMEAAGLLGVREVVFLDYPDQELADTFQFRRDLVREIRKFRPEIVVTTDPYRRYVWHRDHRITGQAVLDAVFPLARTHLSFPDLLEQGYEPHRVKVMLFWGGDEVNYRVDITQTFDLKVSALACHKSQFNEKKSPGWAQWIKQQSQVLAKGETYELAEGFYRVQIR